MTKQILSAAVCLIAAAVLTTPARAGVIQITLPSYDSPDGYDFVTTFPPGGLTTIGTFTPISVPTGDHVTGITISGTFGNGDGSTTALSDYYLGFSGYETAVEVASCDSILGNCYSGQNGPYAWTYSLTSSQLATLAPAISGESLNFTYTWDNNTQFAFEGYDQYVYAGATTVDIDYTPEPAAVLTCLGGLAAIAALRRFRKA
jgi:hypothetical protein